MVEFFLTSMTAMRLIDALIFLLQLIAHTHSAGNTWRAFGTSSSLPPFHSASAVVLRRTDGTDAVFVHGGRGEVLNFRDLRSRAIGSGGAWTTHANGPHYRREHCAVGINSGQQMLVFGGYGGATSSDATMTSLVPGMGRIDVYTVASNAWTSLGGAGSGPTPRARMSCVVHRDSSLIVFGGVTATGARSAELWRFDLGSQAWTNLTPDTTGDVPLAISGHSGTLVGTDSMLIFGGFRDNQFEVREARTLDLVSLVWRLRVSPSSAQPLARESHVAFAYNGGKQVIVSGGLYNGAFLDDVWAIEPLSGAWVQLATTTGAPSGRAAAAAAATLNGTVAVLAGGTDGLPRADTFEYSPPSCASACLNFGVCDGNRCVCDGTGYGGAQCQTPICTPACQNGGACVAPDTCNCTTAARQGKPVYGRQCEGYCGDSILQTPQEVCDDGNGRTGDCCANCAPETFDTVCRAAAGPCDVAEQCGGATVCPPDTFANGPICRPIAGPCDVAETCTGNSGACPVDRYLNTTVICRARDANNTCDIDDYCSGTTPSCPPDRFEAPGTPCDSRNPCSTGDTCSAVGVCQSGTSTCNCVMAAQCDDKNPCTVDTCVNMRCAHTAGNAGVPCREAAGECDVPEQCDGTQAFCPRDRVKMFGTVCRPSAGDCDVPELCDGRSAQCLRNVRLSGEVCRRALGVCDIDEICDGMSDNCPPDLFRTNTTECRASRGPCDPAEFCDGATAHCSAVNYLAPINSPCDDGDLCTENDKCVPGGQCVGTLIVPCVRFDLPTPAPAPGSTPAPIDEAQACYLLRDNCDLCIQLVACGYCATHNGRAGACNPASVEQQCNSIGGAWNRPCGSLSLPPPTPPATPVPTRPRQTPGPPTPAPPTVPRTTTEATTRPLSNVFTVRDPFASLMLPDIFKAGNGTNDGPLGLGWGYVGDVSLEWIFIIGLVICLLICCCGIGLFLIRVKKARDIGRGRR